MQGFVVSPLAILNAPVRSAERVKHGDGREAFGWKRIQRFLGVLMGGGVVREIFAGFSPHAQSKFCGFGLAWCLREGGRTPPCGCAGLRREPRGPGYFPAGCMA
jgi:hypothetical protein